MFLGSVFSTYYAIARALGRGDPLNHCSVNVSLWHRDRYYWSFTERARDTVERSSTNLQIGANHVHWNGTDLTIDIDELVWPRMNRIRGRLRLIPSMLTERSVLLDTSCWHQWWPIAPHARIEVDMEAPDVRWSGTAYFDHNSGQAPLERSFSSWTWSRAHLKDRTAIFYDLKRRGQDDLSVALEAGNDGSLQQMEEPPPAAQLPKTLWRLPRSTRADEHSNPELLKTIEDGPFYVRSLLSAAIQKEKSVVMQETLSLDRLRQAWIRYLVLYRNPRAFFDGTRGT